MDGTEAESYQGSQHDKKKRQRGKVKVLEVMEKASEVKKSGLKHPVEKSQRSIQHTQAVTKDFKAPGST